MGVCRDTGLITGCAVLEERSQPKMQEFVDTLPPAIFYCTDGFSTYGDLVWPLESEHLVSVQKERTHTIESINAQLRTYLARLKRKSRCFSRKLEALWQSVRMFVWHYNRRQRKIRSDPKKYQNRLTLYF
jgi:IS1 family transposase